MVELIEKGIHASMFALHLVIATASNLVESNHSLLAGAVWSIAFAYAVDQHRGDLAAEFGQTLARITFHTILQVDHLPNRERE